MNGTVSKLIQESQEEAELVALVRSGIKRLRRKGYSLRELGLVLKKKKKKKKKPAGAAKDEFADMFALPDLSLAPVSDEDTEEDSETLIYDGDDGENDEDED